MDTIGFNIGLNRDDKSWLVARPIVNGRDLEDIVDEIVFPNIEISTGGDDGLYAKNVLPPSRHFFGSDKYEGRHGAVNITPLLVCTCGYEECGSVYARIVVGDESVTWRDFGAVASESNYGDVGPFVFNRKQYGQALDRAALEYGEMAKAKSIKDAARAEAQRIEDAALAEAKRLRRARYTKPFRFVWNRFRR